MHALLQCWFQSGLCLFFLIHILFQKKKKKAFLIWKMSLFWGLFVFCNDYKMVPFFRPSFRNYRAPNNVLYLFIPCIFIFILFFLLFVVFLETVSCAGPWMVLKGEDLLPYLTLRRCWKQRLKKRTDIKEAGRRDLIMGRATTLGTVLSDNCQSSTQTKKLQKTLPETYFPFVFYLGAFLEESLFGCWERATLMLLWPFEAITATKMGKKCIILQYLQINIVRHGFVLLVRIL